MIVKQYLPRLRADGVSRESSAHRETYMHKRVTFTSARRSISLEQYVHNFLSDANKTWKTKGCCPPEAGRGGMRVFLEDPAVHTRQEAQAAQAGREHIEHPGSTSATDESAALHRCMSAFPPHHFPCGFFFPWAEQIDCKHTGECRSHRRGERTRGAH